MPADQPAPDSLTAMREALKSREGESFQDHDTRVGAECGYHLPAVLEELGRLREKAGLLDELLAAINRDGGHRQNAVGTTRAVAEAVEKVHAWIDGDGWRPIDPDRPETWPDDSTKGTTFQVATPAYYGTISATYRGNGWWASVPGGYTVKPTHYRKIPAAPADGGREKT